MTALLLWLEADICRMLSSHHAAAQATVPAVSASCSRLVCTAHALQHSGKGFRHSAGAQTASASLQPASTAV